MFSVLSRCFQLLSARNENDWRRYSNVVIKPPVANMAWDSFDSAKNLIAAGEQAAMEAMPAIKRWLATPMSLPAAAPVQNPKVTMPVVVPAEAPPA